MITSRRCRFLVVAVAAAALVALSATPAAAHGVGGIGPTNYETSLEAVEPALDDLDVRVIDLGARIEVTNRADTELVVLGYEGEPYLRIGPDGVHENERSPATWANRDRYAESPAPADVDPEAPPVWRQVSAQPTARFHWHLAHWMARTRPGIVDDDPGSEHDLGDWDLTMERGDTEIVATGSLRWVPPPSPVPAILLAAGLAAATVALGRTRAWRVVLVGALAILVANEIVHLVGLWHASSSGFAAKMLENLYSLLGIAIAGLAIARLVSPRRDPFDATPIALIAGVVLTVAGGFADLGALTSSQLPTSVPANLARAGVAITLGVGLGVVVTAALRLRRPTPA